MRNLLYVLKNKWLKDNKPEEYKKELEEYYKSDLHTIVRENVEWFVNHPNLFKYRPIYFVLSINNLSNNKISLDEIIELEERFHNVATGVFGLEYDNFAKVVLSDEDGHLYQFLINKVGNRYEFDIWNDAGIKHLYGFITNNKFLTSKEINNIKRVMYNYINGVVNCSDYGKEIKNMK